MARILVVDDDPTISEMLRTVLTAGGHHVETAADGRVGLRAFGKGQFDVVITDILMPDMDGVETVRTLRAFSASVKILAISGGGAMDHGDVLSTAIRLGADATLPKPFSVPVLLATINQLLNASEARSASGSVGLGDDGPDPRPSCRSSEDGTVGLSSHGERSTLWL